jgi:EmrB/QacA subfamily drug resistance transporter
MKISRKWLAFILLCLGQLMIVLDATIVNVALESIQKSLHFSQANLAWIINAYILTFGGFLLLSGRLGDLLGRKNIFLFGLALFTIASLACGLAFNQIFLITARAIQGIGGAVIASVSLAMVYSLFTSQADQQKAISYISFVSAAGGSVGLIAGGFLTQLLNWHWIFLVNVPIGISIFIAGIFWLEREDGMGMHHGVDLIGAFLITVSSMTLSYTIIQSNESGLLSNKTISLAILSVVLWGVFIFAESKIKKPLVPLHIFARRNLIGASSILSLFVAGLYGWFFLSALYYGKVLNYNSLQTGLAFLPATIILALFSLGIANQIIKKFGQRVTMIGGTAFMLVCLALSIMVPVHANFIVNLLPGMILFGIGGGVSFIPLMTMGMSDASQDEAGLASGLLQTAQQIGAAFGLAILASVATAHTKQLLSNGQAMDHALTGGFQWAFAVATIFLVIAVILEVTVLQEKTGAQHQQPIMH